MKALMILIAAGVLLGLSASIASAQSDRGLTSKRASAKMGPARSMLKFGRPRGVEMGRSGLTGSGVTGRMPRANRSDRDQVAGRRRPPVSPDDSGTAGASGGSGSSIPLGTDSSGPASIMAPPSPFGAR